MVPLPAGYVFARPDLREQTAPVHLAIMTPDFGSPSLPHEKKSTAAPLHLDYVSVAIWAIVVGAMLTAWHHHACMHMSTCLVITHPSLLFTQEKDVDTDVHTSTARQHVVIVSTAQQPESQHASVERGSQSNASAWRVAWWAIRQQKLVALIPVLLLAGGWVG